MIITRTPYRVSFFGGGTDYHTWYEENGGEILSSTINHYNYISCRYFPPFHPEYKNRISWRILEYPEKFEDIQHKAIRGALLYYGLKNGVEISVQSDLPARSGLGSSSSFSAGLIKAIFALKGKMISKYELANETINLERNILKENVGIQDQIAAVYGGLNYIKIFKDASFCVEPVIVNKTREKLFNDHLLLFFTGISRSASDICKKQIDDTKNKITQLQCMQSMVKPALKILSDEKADLMDFGRMLHETWLLKRSLTDKISNNTIDDIYSIAIKNGATGGKLLGAGGGGFILFFAEPQYHAQIKNAVSYLIHVPIQIENQGSQTLLYSPKEYDNINNNIKKTSK
jgi:D-glycero-alpha-D-manno-heptose-7-phosphate kinase